MNRINALSRFLAGVICLSTLATNANARQLDMNEYLNDAELVGEARMTYLFWNVYDARLYAANGSWKPGQPLALELKYLRKLNGEAIAERSVTEIRDQGYENEQNLGLWLEQIRDIFPDVDQNSTLVGIADDRQYTKFYYNGKLIGEVSDPEFTRQFFNIWLGESTSEPKLRKQLLNIN